VLPDFKEVTRARLGTAPDLESVSEGGEYTYGDLTEGGETYRVFKYGKIVALTYEALINDDMSAFTRIPAKLAAAAAHMESDLFWAQVTSNPDMGDSSPVFGSGNQIDTATNVDIDALNAVRADMRKQKDGTKYLNLRPQYLIVPVAQEGYAEQVIIPAPAQYTAEDPNHWAGRMRLIVEPRLDDVTGDNYWYAFADPALIDTVAYAYLRGEESPQLFTEQGFDVDGLKLKIRHSFGAKVLDRKGLHRTKYTAA